MRIFKQGLTPEMIRQITGGQLQQLHETQLDRVSDPRSADSHSIIFLDNETFLPQVKSAQPGLLIANTRFKPDLSGFGFNQLFVDNAYQAVLILIHYWLEIEQQGFQTLIHPTAVIGVNVIVPEYIQIGAYSVIGDYTTLGDYTIIGSGCSLGNKTRIGDHCHIYPNVSIYEDTIIGDKVNIHSGCVIGADGFGYMLLDGKQQKIPQIGQVIIHDMVEIGPNTTIDRGTIGPTIIGEDTKIDNLVQIGHNCEIGKHSILCAQVGLAGSTVVGDYVYLAGQVGVAGHLTIGDKVMVGAQSGIASNLETGKKYFGYPAREAMLMKRIMAAENRLPDIFRLFNKMKKEKVEE